MAVKKLKRIIESAESASLSPSNLKSKSQKYIKISDALSRIKALEKEMTQVIHEMQEKVRQLECLNEFSSVMNSSLDVATVRENATEATCKLLGCEKALLLLVDREKNELYGGNGNRLAIDSQSIAGSVALTGESAVVNRVKEVDYKSIVCVPLKIQNRILGVLQGQNKVPSIRSKMSRKQKWADFTENDKNLLETLSHQVSIAIENSRLYSEIKKNFFETVEALAEAIEKKDHYTGGHTKRVVYYSMCIAKYLNLKPEELEKIRLGAVLHDVGKIGIEDNILKKGSTLGLEEWKIMQTHPELGYDIMRRVEGLKDVIGGMRFHHERWDGKGYPMGLKGEEIPLIARIISVADTYDAMVSTRPYRKGMDPKLAYQEILRYRGTQFDPAVVDAFVEAFAKEKMGKGSGGSSLSDNGKAKLSNCD